MSQSESDDCYSYLVCPEVDPPLFIELGCISSDSLNDNLQTSTLPACRRDKTVRKKVDGVEPQGQFQLEQANEDDKFLFRWLRRAAKSCKTLGIAYLDAPITEVDVDGSILFGATSANWTRDLGEKNLSITQENTGSYFCWDDYLAGGTAPTEGGIGDLPPLGV